MQSELGRKIWKAVREGNRAELARLLNGGVDPVVFRYEEKFVGWGLITALAMAAHKGDTTMVKLLVHAGADLNYQDSELDRTALMLTSAMGHHATALALLQLGSRVNMQNRWERSALIIAADYGHLETVRVLLEWGADKSLRQQDGRLAVEVASNEEIKTLINTYAALSEPVLASIAEVAATQCTELEGECDSLGEQVAQARRRRDAILQRRALQAQLDAAVAAGAALKRIGELGIALEDQELEAAKLPLSEEDYLTLATRHTALMHRVEAKGREFVKVKLYKLVHRMGLRKEALRAMDLSFLILPSEGDHVSVEHDHTTATSSTAMSMAVAMDAPAVEVHDPSTPRN